jgi:TPR repeat protein
MAQQPTQYPRWLPQAGIVLVVGLALAGVGFLSGQHLERNQPVTPQAKLQDAMQAFRSGYDNAALTLLKPLADEGNPKAQYWLADIYENGVGVKPDKAMAIALLEKSAAQGFVPAEGHLGELHLRGNETLQDFGKAQSWLHKAAIAGDTRSQWMLGHIFALGLGVPADPAQAYGWYENAALNGDGLAKRMRDDILTHMSPAEIAKGEQDAKDIATEIKPTKS